MKIWWESDISVFDVLKKLFAQHLLAPTKQTP